MRPLDANPAPVSRPPEEAAPLDPTWHTRWYPGYHLVSRPRSSSRQELDRGGAGVTRDRHVGRAPTIMAGGSAEQVRYRTQRVVANGSLPGDVKHLRRIASHPGVVPTCGASRRCALAVQPSVQVLMADRPTSVRLTLTAPQLSGLQRPAHSVDVEVGVFRSLGGGVTKALAHVMDISTWFMAFIAPFCGDAGRGGLAQGGAWRP